MAMLVPGDRDVCIKVGNRGWGTDPVVFLELVRHLRGKFGLRTMVTMVCVCVIYCNIVIYNNI